MKSKLILLTIFSFFNIAYTQNKTKKTVKKVPARTEVQPVQVQPQEQIGESVIYTEVESMAEFPGGYQLFREKFQNAFNTGAVQDSGLVRMDILFIIDQNGKITDVKSSGNSESANIEAKRALESLTDIWIPAKINGRPVKYRYRLPVALQF